MLYLILLLLIRTLVKLCSLCLSSKRTHTHTDTQNATLYSALIILCRVVKASITSTMLQPGLPNGAFLAQVALKTLKRC